jgi:hypothetical protein
MVQVRHMGRDVVKFGHWDEYVATSKALNEVLTRLGNPAYRLYQSNWGTLNEAFWEAEYESSADIEARFAAAKTDPEFGAALEANFSHVVDGESRDYVLSEVVE